MTNQIDQLWGKALDQAMPDTYTNLTWTQVEKIKQVFAELIVRECMRMCEVAEVGYDSHGHTKEANGCVLAKEYIAEHFGVE
jgi:hypothetical protein